jgi:hypothetical protein
MEYLPTSFFPSEGGRDVQDSNPNFNALLISLTQKHISKEGVDKVIKADFLKVSAFTNKMTSSTARQGHCWTTRRSIISKNSSCIQKSKI